MSDGILIFDTDIDLKGFKKGLANIRKLTERASLNVLSDFKKNIDKISADKAVKNVNKDFTSMSTQINKLTNESAKLVEKAYEGSLNNVSNKSTSTGEKIKSALKSASSSVARSFLDMAVKGTSTLGNLSNYTNKVGKAIGSVIKAGVDVAINALKGLAKAALDATKKALDQMVNLAKKSVSAINSAMKAIATAVAAVGVSAGVMGANFEEAMSRVMAISGATDEEFKRLKETAEELGRTTVFSASEAANGMEELAKAGYKTNDIIAAMPGLLSAASASGLDVAQTTSIVTGVLGAFNMKAGEAGKVADILTYAAVNSKTSVDTLGETMKYAAPLANQLGISLEEVASVAGLLGDSSIEAGQAGTSLRAIMKRLASPPKQAAAALDSLGITMDDGTGKMKSMSRIIAEVSKATQGMTDIQKAAIASQIAGTEASSAFLVLMSNGGDRIEKFANDIANSEGKAAEISAKMLSNFKGDLQLLKSAFEGFGVAIYDNFSEPLRQSTQFVTGWINAFAPLISGLDDYKDKLKDIPVISELLGDKIDKLPDGVEGIQVLAGEMIKSILDKIAGALPEGIKVAVDFIGKIGEAIVSNSDSIGQSLSTIFTSLLTGLVDLYPIFIDVGLNIMQSMLTGIVQNAPMLITSLFVAVSNAITSVEGLLPGLLGLATDFINQFAAGFGSSSAVIITSISNIFNSIMSFILTNLPTFIEMGTSLILNLANGLMTSGPLLIETIFGVIDSLIGIIVNSAPQLLTLGVTLITKLAEGLANSAEVLVSAITEVMPMLVEALISSVGVLAPAALSIIQALLEGIIDNLPEIVKGALDLITTLADALIKATPSLIKAAIEIIVVLAQCLIDALPWLIEEAPRIINEFMDALISQLPKLILAAIQIIIALGKGLIENIPLLLANIDQIILAIINVFTLISWAGIGKSFITKMSGGIKSLSKDIPNVLKNIASKAISFIKNIFSQGPNIGRNLIANMKGGIISLIDDIPNILKTVGHKGLSAVKSAFAGIGEIGKNLIIGLWNGINDKVQWIKNKIKGFGETIIKSIKSIFDIHSPSRLMRDEIGNNITLGIGVGLEEGVPDVLKTIKSKLPKITNAIKGVVNSEQLKVSSAGFNPQSTVNKINPPNENYVLAGNVKTTIEVDRREVGYVITPFISEEIERSNKRNR